MMKSFSCIICLMLISTGIHCQDINFDSLVQTRKTDTLSGRVKTYYSPGHKEIASQLQQLVTNAIFYYEKKYNVKFSIQLAVLDSAQWFREVIPYGFVFYEGTHWLILNTGMNYASFKSTYGLNSISANLDSAFKKNKISPDQVIYSRLKFLSLHELGHYFVYRLSATKAPNTWTNEFIASYFANEYITQFEPDIKIRFDVFCRTVARYYPAEHTSLADFDSLYFKMKIGNFAWYHSRFYFLCDTLYHCSGNSYFNTFQMNFPNKEGMVYSTKLIDKLVEGNCPGSFSKWNKAGTF
jgi:hypothetical protein